MPVVDADTHVVETEHTWDFLDPSEEKYRPIVVAPRGEEGRFYWYVDGKIRGLARNAVTAQDVKKLEQLTGRRMDAPEAARTGENVQVRLDHMDRLGVDVQVLWPTIFLERVADKPEVEAAVCRSYNRWLAGIWGQSQNRLRWMAVLPLQTMSEAIEQLDYCQAHGAVGIFMRGIEGEWLVNDPYFDPLYHEVIRRNMVVGVHAGIGNPYMAEMMQRRNTPGTFWRYRMTGVGAFHALVMEGMPDRLPGLRMVFVELAAAWLPYVLNDLKRRLPQQKGRQLPDEPLKAYRIYVSCQSDDDLPYIMKHAGTDNIVMGTDYGHNDHAADLEGLRNLANSGDISQEIYRKVVDENPTRAYALGQDATPIASGASGNGTSRA